MSAMQSFAGQSRAVFSTALEKSHLERSMLSRGESTMSRVMDSSVAFEQLKHNKNVKQSQVQDSLNNSKGQLFV